MIMWQIKDSNIEYEIEIGPITILKGTKSIWFQLVRLIDDYFNNKNSSVQIVEDIQAVYKKDWDCYFIPFDTHLQFDKLTVKSPLKSLIDETFEQLSLNPIVKDLFEVWDSLNDELELISNKLINDYYLQILLQPITFDNLKKFIQIKSKKSIITPYDYKELFLKLYLKRPIEKKRLVIIEFPEFYADSKKTHELIQTIKYWSKKGTYFLIVSNFEIDGQRNIEYEGKIINNGKIESIKKQVINALPFYCDDIMYEEAKEDLLEVVDNINFDDYYLNLSTINDQKKLVIIFTINYFLGLRFPVDINGFPENLVNFIRSYS